MFMLSPKIEKSCNIKVNEDYDDYVNYENYENYDDNDNSDYEYDAKSEQCPLLSICMCSRYNLEVELIIIAIIQDIILVRVCIFPLVCFICCCIS